MKVAAIDQRDVHGRALQLLRGIQTTESSAKNYDPVPLFHTDRSSEHNLALSTIISSTMISTIQMLWARAEIPLSSVLA